ncbi:MAG: phosphatase PAP2 family protein [Ruminococcus sp.]|nr:phosphatase PAP2 family protein [Ruminococcus sp.]
MEYIVSFDFAILDFIQAAIKNAFFDPVMMMFSYVGEIGAVWIIIALGMLFSDKTRVTGAMVLAALVLVALAGEIGIKHLVARTRPFLINTDVTLNIVAPSGYSFPSVHAAAAFASALVIAVREKLWMGIGVYVLASLIAFSRLYNYVHFPTDVFAGMILGTLCALVLLFILKKAKLETRILKIGVQRKDTT